jgi:O-methyltransferase
MAATNLLKGFPLRHARWFKSKVSPPAENSFTVPGIIHSRIAPTATYSPWLSDDRFMDVYEDVKSHTLVDIYRCYELWTLAKQLPEGAILEVGVWRGGTGAILAAANEGRRVYLADTFTGVVKAGSQDTRYKGGEHADTSKGAVLELLESLGLQAIVLEGVFPDETGTRVLEPIAMLHCDVDAYESTRDIVLWTLPRLVRGGVMVFDDYGFSGCEGVTTLCNELRGDRSLLFLHNLNGHAIFVKL